MKTIEEICTHAFLLRKQARTVGEWELNIYALLESNHEIFEGPISLEDMEDCFNHVLDLYDPNVMIRNGELTEEDYSCYIESYDGNPFWSLFQVDEKGNVIDVFLYETDDCEAVGAFLEEKYKRKK
ncbi:hypothetical protein [Flagellimonas iocasae]|uniref:Uncharacterized protein n=1 Tax=Flagellimonas iocasae TaxID=2055905 RepID=A0ABW4XXW9_9FLAO